MENFYEYDQLIEMCKVLNKLTSNQLQLLQEYLEKAPAPFNELGKEAAFRVYLIRANREFEQQAEVEYRRLQQMDGKKNSNKK